jgi:hypothetical protein
MWIVSIVALCFVVALCALGIWHQAFKDNVLQCIGMCVLVVACAGRIWWLYTHQFVDPSWMLVHVGMAIYALGTFLKVLIRHGRDRGWSSISGFDRALHNRKTGSGDFDDSPHHHH